MLISSAVSMFLTRRSRETFDASNKRGRSPSLMSSSQCRVLPGFLVTLNALETMMPSKDTVLNKIYLVNGAFHVNLVKKDSGNVSVTN